MELADVKAACAIVYDHDKKAVLMGLRGDCNMWSFAGGKSEATDVGDSYTARRELAEEFGLRFDSVQPTVYVFTSSFVHQTDLGHALTPGRKSYIKNGVKYYKDAYYLSHVFLFEYNRKAVKHILKGVKDNEMDKVRWVKLEDMLKVNMWPASIVVFNIFLRHMVECGNLSTEQVRKMLGGNET